MKSVLTSLLVSVCLLLDTATAGAATFTGTVFDLEPVPQPRVNRNITITVTGLDQNDNEIALPQQIVSNADGTYRVVVNDPRVRAVTLLFEGDGLEPTTLSRLLNNVNRTVDVAMPNARAKPPACCYPVYYCPPPAPRCRFFRR